MNRDDRSLGEIAGQQCVSHSSAVFHLKPSYCQHTYETTCERCRSLLTFHDAVIIPEVTIGHCMLFNRWSHCDEMAAVGTDFITRVTLSDPLQPQLHTHTWFMSFQVCLWRPVCRNIHTYTADSWGPTEPISFQIAWGQRSRDLCWNGHDVFPSPRLPAAWWVSHGCDKCDVKEWTSCVRTSTTWWLTLSRWPPYLLWERNLWVTWHHQVRGLLSCEQTFCTEHEIKAKSFVVVDSASMIKICISSCQVLSCSQDTGGITLMTCTLLLL